MYRLNTSIWGVWVVSVLRHRNSLQSWQDPLVTSSNPRKTNYYPCQVNQIRLKITIKRFENVVEPLQRRSLPNVYCAVVDSYRTERKILTMLNFSLLTKEHLTKPFCAKDNLPEVSWQFFRNRSRDPMFSHSLVTLTVTLPVTTWQTWTLYEQVHRPNWVSWVGHVHWTQLDTSDQTPYVTWPENTLTDPVKELQPTQTHTHGPLSYLKL